MSKYTFYEDPGHGWLEVPVEDLIEAGVANKISSCSYRDDNGMAYLEEDCDMAIFLEAKAGPARNGAEGGAYAHWWELYWTDHSYTTRGMPEIWIRKLGNYWVSDREKARMPAGAEQLVLI